MPQIGWFEILIIVVLAIVVIGPEDFPKMLKKIGSWIGSFKNYFREVQRDLTVMENITEDDDIDEKYSTNIKKHKKKDE